MSVRSLVKRGEDGLRWLFGPSVLLWFVTLGVLAGSAVLGMRANQRLVMMIAAGVGGLIAFIGLMRWMQAGILLLIPITYLVKWGVGTGTQTELNLTILWLVVLLGVWIVKMVVNERQVRLSASRVNLPILLFAAWVVVALVGGNVKWMVFSSVKASTFSQIGGLLMMILPMGILLLMGNVVREEKWLRWMVWVFLGIGAIYLTANWSPIGGVVVDRFNGKAVSSLFYTWGVALALSMWLFNDSLKGLRRFGMVLFTALALGNAFLLMRGSASIWLPAMIVMVVLVWLKSWRVGVVVTLMVGAVALWQHDAIYARVMGVESYSALTRAATWPIMFELVKASPIVGLGPSNYYFYTPLFSLMGYYVEFNSHNNYWDLAVQTGLVGLGLFIWVAAALGWTGMKLRKVVKTGFQLGYVNSAVAGLVGTLAAGMLGDWFMPFVYNIGFDGFRGAAIAWLFLGGMIAVEGMVKEGQGE